ncbi:uncharacterized protein LOC123443411 isoform X1 [Hordeum vulgare subsp. vulgare]|uniref:uncharacterized protein LOC123443411 isoform X1 n=1 Tax=Hordeum vulgare subsp. vulgare TaxID=112509 RepID=UPI001D1A3B22|nr:uncharacterized protein LOC123443411 isoform X1 [Hordeum vulgare subsp. vulgare]
MQTLREIHSRRDRTPRSSTTMSPTSTTSASSGEHLLQESVAAVPRHPQNPSSPPLARGEAQSPSPLRPPIHAAGQTYVAAHKRGAWLGWQRPACACRTWLCSSLAMTGVSTGHTTGWLVGLVAVARLRLPDLAVQLLGHDRRLNRSHDRAARQACGGAWRRGRGSERKDVVDRSVSAMDLMLGGEGRGRETAIL